MQSALFIIGAVVAFIYGTAIGSFLNVCIYRLPRGESLVHPPSHCPRCDARLRVRDLVPLLSYLLLRGKCRYCGVRIAPRYFTIEAITGLLFVATWWSLAARLPDLLPTVPGLILLVLALVWVSAMLVTFMIDLDTTYVIEPVTWLAMAAGVLFEVVLKWGDPTTPIGVQVGTHVFPYIPTAVPGMMIGFLVFIAIDLFGGLIFRKPSMGVGDAFIGAAIGAMLGPGLALLSFGMAVLLAVIVGVALLVGQAIRARRPGPEAPALADEPEAPRAYLPLVPFLGAAAALGLLWMVQAYSSAVLADNYGTQNSLVALAAPIVMGALVIITLILLEPLWPKQTVDIETADEGIEEELPEGNYIPFGPFLTACAVVVALLPQQVMHGTRALWDWYMHLYR